MTKKTTLRDVAKEAGVSVATASYVLNNVTNQTIPEDTKNKVYAAANKLKYVQNLTARSLSLGRTNLLGVLLTSSDEDLVSKHIGYGKFLDRLERLCNERNYHLIVSRIDPHKPDFGIVAERKLDGVFLIDVNESSFYAIAEKFQFGSPVVLVDSIIEDTLFRQVLPDLPQLFRIITGMCGGTDYAVVHESFHNRTIADKVQAAGGFGEDAVLAVSDQTLGELQAFAERHGDKPIVVMGEFLALRMLPFADPARMIVVCTAECPEYAPNEARTVVLRGSKAETASALMHALLKEPFGSGDLNGTIPFVEPSPIPS